MSKLKKFAGMMLALVMCLAMSTTAFAASTTTGSITIGDSGTVSVEGKTFNAYKLLDLTLTGTDDPLTDADERGYVYTVTSEWKGFFLIYFTSLDENSGQFSADVADAIANLSTDQLYAFGVAASNYATNNNISATATVTGAEGATSVTISNLALGYYLVVDASTSGTISAVILDSTNTNVTVTLKAEEPPLDKVIVESDGSTTDTNNVAVGGTVPYELTSTVPAMTGYTKYYFVVTDTLSEGLTYNNDMTITVGDYTLECASLNGESQSTTGNYLYDLTVTENSDGTTTLKIVFKDFIQYKSIAGADITISYSATVNENAVIGNTGNDNTAQLIYSNDPNYSDDSSSDEPNDKVPTGTTPEQKTTTYVTGIQLTKVNDAGDTLTGATFTLTGTATNKVQVTGEFYVEDDNGTYWKLNDGTYTTTDPSAEGVDTSVYASTTQKYSKTTSTWVETTGTNAVTATATVDDNGVLTFNGLSAGTYTITEIVAPDGYNLLSSPIEITISWTAPTNGAGTACTWSVTGGSASVNSDGIITLTVENQAGTVLPSTGGIGTTIFYIVGGLLVCGAAVLLITRKRMEKR